MTRAPLSGALWVMRRRRVWLSGLGVGVRQFNGHDGKVRQSPGQICSISVSHMSSCGGAPNLICRDAVGRGGAGSLRGPKPRASRARFGCSQKMSLIPHENYGYVGTDTTARLS